MDRYERSYFELHFENHYLKLTGNSFQDFFSDLMEKVHPADFERIRISRGDQKNDGLLRSQRTLFQVYAPVKMNNSDTTKKIKEDFEGAIQHWDKDFDTWIFVHNSKDGLTPEVVKLLNELEAGSEKSVTNWGFEEIRQSTITKLSTDDLSPIFGYPPSQAHMSNLGLEDLEPVLKQVALGQPTDTQDLRPASADKIRRNQLSSHVDSLLKLGMSRANLVSGLFALEPLRKDKLAVSFNNQYLILRQKGLMPDQIFVELQKFAGGHEVPSPERQTGVYAVLSYFFEECDIFERGDETQ